MAEAARQEIAERQEPSVPATNIVRMNADSLMGAIIKVASDPTMDVTKLRQLEELHGRILDRQARAAFDAALSDMQPELPSIAQKGRITITDKNDRRNVIQATPYALFNDINEAIKPKLQGHGFAVRFETETTPEGKILVTCILSHRDGHREKTTSPPLMHDSTGSKNSVQAIGSTVSYGKRYTLMMALNLTSHMPEDADDDGALAGGPAMVTPEQVDQIIALANRIGATEDDERRLVARFKVKHLHELPASRFQEAIDAINAMKGRQP